MKSLVLPGPLGTTLVGPVVGIGLQLALLPLLLSGALAFLRGAVGLLGDLWAGLERLATAGAVLGRHRFLPTKIRIEPRADGADQLIPRYGLWLMLKNKKACAWQAL